MELCREAVWHALERDEDFRRSRISSRHVPQALRTPLEHHRINVIDFGALSCTNYSARQRGGEVDSDEHSNAEETDTDTDTDDVKPEPSPSPDEEEEEEEEGRIFERDLIYVLSYDTMQWTPMTRSSVRFELD